MSRFLAEVPESRFALMIIAAKRPETTTMGSVEWWSEMPRMVSVLLVGPERIGSVGPICSNNKSRCGEIWEP